MAAGGVLAQRTYSVRQASGADAKLTFSLSDPHYRSDGPWEAARLRRACSFGLVAIERIESAPVLPVMWTFSPPDGLELLIADAEPDHKIAPEVRLVIEQGFKAFFAEVVKPRVMSPTHAAALPMARRRRWFRR